jgi:FkbM family methyltransferase
MTPDEREQLRAAFNSYVVNAQEARSAYIEKRQLPPLLLTSGYVLHYDCDDPVAFLLWEIFRNKAYTGDGFYLPRPHDAVIDLGAHIGVFMIYLLSLERDLRIFCFEPNDLTRERLTRNVASNGLWSNVAVFPQAIYSANTVRLLNEASSSSDWSLITHPHAHPSGRSQQVNCIDLRGAFDVCAVHAIDLLKMDVEGAELEILEAAKHFDWNRVARVSLEFHGHVIPNCGSRVASLLRHYGYNQISWDENSNVGIIRATRI